MVTAELRNRHINDLVDRYHNNPDSFISNKIKSKNTNNIPHVWLFRLLGILCLLALTASFTQSVLFFINFQK